MQHRSFAPPDAYHAFNLFKKGETELLRQGEKRALAIFRETAAEVPAYKDFLRRNRVNPARILSIKDFSSIPPVGRENYLRFYPLDKLCRKDWLSEPIVFSATSGSTGEPFYFPRNGHLDYQSSIYHEMFLRNDPDAKSKRTLVVIGFAMGSWVAGLITFRAFQLIAERGYKISILTPGINKKEILSGIKRLGKKFDQVIICGYPPFIKDVMEDGVNNGIDWNGIRTKIIFAAETFSEEFRSYMSETVAVKNPITDTMNIYGSADLGTMAEETPLSISLRKRAAADKDFSKGLFSSAARVPTLCQYNPLAMRFESEDGRILCTGDNILPLVRYDIGDHGGVLKFSDIAEVSRDSGSDPISAARKSGVKGEIFELPFVYVFERADLSTKLYGANMHPEHIRIALQNPVLRSHLTGKFTMSTKTDRRHNQFLEINLECKPNAVISQAISSAAGKSILQALLEKNSEFKNNYRIIPKKVTPKLVFHPYAHKKYFGGGIKHSWVKKS